MKIFRLFFVSILLLSLISCSSSDDSPSFDVVGSWKMTQGTIEPGTFNMDMGGISVPIDISGNFVEIDENNRINFLSDHTFTSHSGTIVLEITMNFMGTSQTERFEESNFFGEGTWEMNGNQLKIKNSNGTTIPYQLEKISDNEIELSGNVKDMDIEEGGDDPMLESLDIVVKMRLKRV
ncbi:hypothetical protein EI546_09260 [Aequorivita sp. H23M31]|uniref:Lipocalin-like domain-containing protein n=1 Tax=Aequorivita ciconiae TaxID=2494375 RepID=A0A410G3N0_9FLAO|nr:lipocalin family protein [Aequorivita sp. H23M31]QAA81898.1 hypothetical protein EI546_09260 [Aequorivita sp. H23M31]